MTKNTISKTCRKCGVTKQGSEFKPNAKISDGLSSWCRSCHVEATRRWREAHPEEVERYNRGRRQEVSEVRCTVCAELFERPSAARHTICSHACLARRRARR